MIFALDAPAEAHALFVYPIEDVFPTVHAGSPNDFMVSLAPLHPLYYNASPTRAPQMGQIVWARSGGYRFWLYQETLSDTDSNDERVLWELTPQAEHSGPNR